jgi:hypothetical protein
MKTLTQAYRKNKVRLMLSNRIIALTGVMAFAGVLAWLISGQLTSEAFLLTFGMAVGVLVGVPLGMGAMAYLNRQKQGHSNSVSAGMTQEQADILIHALNRQQASPDSFPLSAKRERRFTSVGGVELPEQTDSAQH